MHGISQYYVAPRCGNPYKSTFCYVQALRAAMLPSVSQRVQAMQAVDKHNIIQALQALTGTYCRVCKYDKYETKH